MRLVFVGGGTGGHFYPLVAIAEAIRDIDKTNNENSELFYLGPEAYNQSVLDSLDIKYSYIPAGKQRVYFSFLNILDKFKILAGVVVSFFKLLSLYPDVVMSKGSYTSVPVVIAAKLLRIPVVIHESDVVAGRANLFASKFARYIGVAHAEAVSQFGGRDVAHIGMPIRKAFFTRLSDPYETLGIRKDKPVILVTGGSSGATRLNNFIISSLPRLLPKYTVIHQVGVANVREVSDTASALFVDRDILKNYFVFGHLDQEQFVAALQSASIVITRAGSTALFEIAESAKPAIVVPIPEDISRDQRSNAYAYASATGAVVLEEHNLSDDLLVAEIDKIMQDPELYKQMSEGTKALTGDNAAYTLAEALRSIAREHE